MTAVVLYESMYGNTRQTAQAIGAGLGERTRVQPASAAGELDWAGVELVVLGAPTHAWSLPRPATRKSAATDGPAKGLTVEGTATRTGVREWLATSEQVSTVPIAAFDTRIDKPRLVTGSAAHACAQLLRRRGVPVRQRTQSFFVRDNELLPGELERATAWGRELAGSVPSNAGAGKHGARRQR